MSSTDTASQLSLLRILVLLPFSDDELSWLCDISPGRLRRNLKTLASEGLAPKSFSMDRRSLYVAAVLGKLPAELSEITCRAIADKLEIEQDCGTASLLRHEIEHMRRKLEAQAETLHGIQRAVSASLGTGFTWNKHLSKSVDELRLNVRLANALQNAGIEFIWQLCEKTETELLKLKNFGHEYLREIIRALAPLNLRLAMDLEGFPRPT